MTDTVLIVAAVFLTLPYAYIFTRVCATAYFEEKLEYQRKFFKRFEIHHNTGHH